MCVYIYMYTHTYTHIMLYISGDQVHAYIHTCTHASCSLVRMHTCSRVYQYAYIHPHTHIQREREREREREERRGERERCEIAAHTYPNFLWIECTDAIFSTLRLYKVEQLVRM